VARHGDSKSDQARRARLSRSRGSPGPPALRQHYRRVVWDGTTGIHCGRLLAQGPHRLFGVRDSGKPEQDLFVHSYLPALAQEKGLKPTETDYVRSDRSGTVRLKFFLSGGPQIEKIFRTHYVSPALSERDQQKLQEKLERAPQPVVFLNLRDAQCSECGAEIAQGSMLLMEADQPLCLYCARLDG